MWKQIKRLSLIQVNQNQCIPPWMIMYRHDCLSHTHNSNESSMRVFLYAYVMYGQVWVTYICVLGNYKTMTWFIEQMTWLSDLSNKYLFETKENYEEKIKTKTEW